MSAVVLNELANSPEEALLIHQCVAVLFLSVFLAVSIISRRERR